ncbi:hypothetical protein L249_8565 [Ophiocordyceps polyrhachis-furcata BCC 54312]|uniref:Uncharacterized protein n=1 Tax=Ophiocordyceps polyrhachis-furcata BCC 54312 TaxID=1330021 RepID=A0A367L6G4_9HYPO|nr:hypothetical protein L249_8565 [Ophiocordyceps polyrhachis-furcata BCC 54312]
MVVVVAVSRAGRVRAAMFRHGDAGGREQGKQRIASLHASRLCMPAYQVVSRDIGIQEMTNGHGVAGIMSHGIGSFVSQLHLCRRFWSVLDEMKCLAHHRYQR